LTSLDHRFPFVSNKKKQNKTKIRNKAKWGLKIREQKAENFLPCPLVGGLLDLEHASEKFAFLKCCWLALCIYSSNSQRREHWLSVS
jgi:hypothetical protein